MTPAVVAVELLATIGVSIVACLALSDSAARDRRLLERASGEQRSQRLQLLRRAINDRLRRTRWGGALDQRLRGAAVAMSPLDFALAVLGVEIVVVAVLYQLMGRLGSLVLALGLAMLSNRWIEARRQKRLEAFIGQLPEVARVMSNGASAGLAMRSSVGLAARELDDPAGVELRIVAEQLDLGHTLSSALDDLRRRLPSRELGVLVQTLIIQSRSGGALVTALVNIATTLEQRKELRREIRTATSGALFSGYVVVAIGVLSVFVMNLFTPGALDQLAGTFIGRIVLAAASALFLGGFVLMRRITKIEV